MYSRIAPRKCAAVIFDLDGTLIDSIEAFYQVLSEIFCRMNLPPLSKEEVLRRVFRSGLSPWESLISPAVPNRKDFINRCMAINKEIWPIIYPQKARLFPGSRPTIEYLSQKGIKIGIVTSGREVNNEIHHLLFEGRILPHVNTIIMRHDTLPPKPAPDTLLLCLERLDVPPEFSVMVGDAPEDIKAGKAAGTRTAAVLSGVGTLESLQPLNPDWIIQGIEEIANMLSIT